jgi:hypothetical protein
MRKRKESPRESSVVAFITCEDGRCRAHLGKGRGERGRDNCASILALGSGAQTSIAMTAATMTTAATATDDEPEHVTMVQRPLPAEEQSLMRIGVTTKAVPVQPVFVSSQAEKVAKVELHVMVVRARVLGPKFWSTHVPVVSLGALGFAMPEPVHWALSKILSTSPGEAGPGGAGDEHVVMLQTVVEPLFSVHVLRRTEPMMSALPEQAVFVSCQACRFVHVPLHVMVVRRRVVGPTFWSTHVPVCNVLTPALGTSVPVHWALL